MVKNSKNTIMGGSLEALWVVVAIRKIQLVRIPSVKSMLALGFH